ncbi:MAG: Cas9 endonuclease PAM-interacting domain-containing protein [Clostridia bacterium]|nr:Cas9 endonuclease PAM-interacting domain-containing protein [Clostridia bacterium]
MQCEAIIKIIALFRCVGGNTDLSLIGAGKTVGTITLTKNINDKITIKILNQSVTGVFSKEVNLNTI